MSEEVRESDATRAPSAIVLPLLSLLSGMGSVVYEVIYMREMTSILGDMYYVHATLISVFLFGLGLGALLARHAVRYLFAFEGFIGLWALAFPVLLSAWAGFAASFSQMDPLLYTILSVVVLLTPPAVAIGFSVPLFSRYVEESGASDEAFALTYYAYNFGACVSILLVEFFILRWFGHHLSLRFVAGLNLLCGAILFWRRAEWTPPALTPDKQGTTPAARELAALFSLSVASALFHGFFLLLSYNLLRPYRENFALCTAAVLLGIALGSDFFRKRPSSFPRIAAMGAVAVAIVCAAAPVWRMLYDPSTALLGGLDILHRFVVLAILGGIPYVFLGATIPALVKGHDTTLASGRCLMVSGVGNVVGFWAYVFLIHPNMHVLAVGGIICGLLMISVFASSGDRLAKGLVIGALLLSLTGLLHNQRILYLLHLPVEDGQEVEFIKNTSDTVALVSWKDGSLRLGYNGHPSIMALKPGAKPNRNELISGLLSAPFAPSRSRAMVLGMGTGFTAGSAAQVYDHVDVVEINHSFWELVTRLKEHNFDLANNPAATLYHEDGRRFLSHTEQQYDVIINSIPSPRFAAASKVYTLEFLQQVEQRLVKGGVYATWFTAGDMSPDGVTTLLTTIGKVFDHCQLSIIHRGYYFLTCSNTPLVRAPFEALELSPEYKKAMEGHLETKDLAIYLEATALSDDIFANGKPSRGINRDAFPILEYQVMAFSRGITDATGNPILKNRESWGIDLTLASDRDTAIEQATIWREIAPHLYEELILPEIERRGLEDALPKEEKEEKP